MRVREGSQLSLPVCAQRLPVLIWTVKIWTVITNPNPNPKPNTNPNKNPNPNHKPSRNPVLTVQISRGGDFTV